MRKSNSNATSAVETTGNDIKKIVNSFASDRKNLRKHKESDEDVSVDINLLDTNRKNNKSSQFSKSNKAISSKSKENEDSLKNQILSLLNKINMQK